MAASLSLQPVWRTPCLAFLCGHAPSPVLLHDPCLDAKGSGALFSSMRLSTFRLVNVKDTCMLLVMHHLT